MAVCLNHPDREAAVRCGSCGKPLCQECVFYENYCSPECRQAGINAAARAAEVIKERKHTEAALRPGKILLIIILLLIAGGLGYYYVKNRKQIDYKARTLSERLQKSTRDSIKNNQYRATDSKYKRDREALVK